MTEPDSLRHSYHCHVIIVVNGVIFEFGVKYCVRNVVDDSVFALLVHSKDHVVLQNIIIAF